MSSRAPETNPSFPALEERVLARWRERDVFGASLRNREGAEPWVFYEGPPTANGRPGSHHVLARAFKDVFPRFQTMRGRYVERKGGWDCHGLPVEITVEKELGLSSKQEIEAYGIEAFNARCRDSVFDFLEEWDRLTERIGYWVDLDAAYRTLDPGYVERVWGALKAIWDADLLYEGHRVVPYCPRCGTALSSHEVGQPGAYQDVVDPSVFVRFPVTDGTTIDVDGDPAEDESGLAGGLREGDVLLAWTTTPWTLVANAALAVHPELTYVRATGGALREGEVGVVAEALLERVLGEGAEVLERLPGADLAGAAYAPPLDFLPSDAWGPNGHTVLTADFVTADDGTGIVHTAIAFGADDYELGTNAGLTVVNPVRPDGTYDERIGDLAGVRVHDANPRIVERLEASGALLREEAYEHSYPHCWRCGTALIYYAKPSWYIATSQVRDRLVAANERIGWHPPHIKHGRFGAWLQGNVDWALSRERYWGTPLPVWRCDAEGCEEARCVGSLAELGEASGTTLEDPHRPFVDDVTIPCSAEGCTGTLRRVPEVIDVWFDSGCMPFAQDHADLATTRDQGRWPAQYICEAIDQTRGWFYSLLAVAVLLQEAEARAGGASGADPTTVRSPYDDVVCLGLLLDEDGQKMSKSKGNVVAPWDVIDRHGADAFRWYLFTSKQPWDGYRFSIDAVGESARRFLGTLWNTYAFWATYAGTAAAGTHRGAGVAGDGPDELASAAAGGAPAGAAAMDAWIRSRLTATVAEVTERLDAFDATFGGRAIEAFVDDLSNWYVRRSRRRFWDGEPAALETLRDCLLTVSRLLAPFCPFVADELHQGLVAGRAGVGPQDDVSISVHVDDWPTVDEPARPRDVDLEAAMAVARETVRLGLAARGQAKVKVRQPLHEAVVVAAGAERSAIERLAPIVREELNVRELRFVTDADELGRYEVKPNYRALGPRFGRSMPQLADAVAGLDADHVAVALREGRTVGVHVDGAEHPLGADDLLLRMEPIEGYQLEREGGHAVALELALDDDLRREGLAREIVHAVQAARKDAGLEVSDRIALRLAGDPVLLEAARAHAAYVTGETLAPSGTIEGEPGTDAYVATVDGAELRVGVTRA